MSAFNKTERTDRIQVHTPEILEEIVGDNAKNESLYIKGSHARSHPRSMSAPVLKSRNLIPPSARLSTAGAEKYRGCRIQTWLNEDSVRDIQERSDFESKSVRNICTAVLDNEDTLVRDVDALIEYNDISNENRQALLFKKWSERVYTPLKEKIDMEMNSSNFKDYDRRKRDLYEKYLDYGNKKGMVFLDVYSPKEYNPLELNTPRPGPLKARVHKLDRNDPLVFQDFKRVVEDQDTLRCQTGRTTKIKDIRNYHLPAQPLVPLGRQNTNCRTWLRMPIHDIDSPPRLKSRQKMNMSSNYSQLHFDKWKSSILSPQLVDVELHSQKKRQYPEKYEGRPIFDWPEVPRTYQQHCRTLSEMPTF